MNLERVIAHRSIQLVWIFTLFAGLIAADTVFSADAVHVILKNDSSSSVDVELIDQYGGNFSASIDGGMASNQTLKVDSDIVVNGSSVHRVASSDESQEIVVAQ